MGVGHRTDWFYTRSGEDWLVTYQDLPAMVVAEDWIYGVWSITYYFT